MVELASLISRLKPIKIVVAGDLMLDAYVVGNVKRISPEAPVPVMIVENEHEVPGGAGNVMLNLCSLGVQVQAIGRIGVNDSGIKLLESLQLENIMTQGVLQQEDYYTPVKKRIIANNQQMLRLDYETIFPLPKVLEDEIIEKLPELFVDAKALAISDYAKGFLTDRLLKALIDYARYLEIPVIVDPKGINFTKYSNSTLLKPNLSEAYASVGKDFNVPISEIAYSILRTTGAKEVMITRSEKGISLFSDKCEETHFPVEVKEVKDVTGAGDTVLAVMSHALGNGLSSSEACFLSNIAAGIAIEKLGCSRVNLRDLAGRLLKINSCNKIFDEQQLEVLKELLVGREFIILSLSCELGISTSMIQTIFNLTDPNRDLLIHIQENNPDKNFVNVLSSLQQVDYIVINQLEISILLSMISPKEVHYFEAQTFSQCNLN